MISCEVHPRSHYPFFIPVGKPSLHLLNAANVVRVLNRVANPALILGQGNSQHSLPYLVPDQNSSILLGTLVLTSFIPLHQEVVEIAFERHNDKFSQTFRSKRFDFVVL